MSGRKIILVDFDGTLCDITHRLHFINDKRKKRDWNAFFDACDEDKPKQPVIDLVNTLYTSGKYWVYIISGRSDRVHDKSVRWLEDHKVEYHAFHMRPEGDHQPDYLLKEGWLETIKAKNVALAIDDRTQVVDMWRRNGITTLQVEKGNF